MNEALLHIWNLTPTHVTPTFINFGVCHAHACTHSSAQDQAQHMSATEHECEGVHGSRVSIDEEKIRILYACTVNYNPDFPHINQVFSAFPPFTLAWDLVSGVKASAISFNRFVSMHRSQSVHDDINQDLASFVFEEELLFTL